MREKNMTVRQASVIAGVGPSTIDSWRSGAAPEDYLAVRRLAAGLGTTLSFLLTGEHEQQGPLSVYEVLAPGEIVFDGLAKITIQRMVPRKPKLGANE